MRPCGRCNAGDGYDESDHMLREVQLTFGVNEWLCFSCYKNWLFVLQEHPLSNQFARTKFQLEWYTTKLESTGEGDLNIGLKYLDELNAVEDEIVKVARKWLKEKKDGTRESIDQEYEEQ